MEYVTKPTTSTDEGANMIEPTSQRGPRACECGARLASDNSDDLCSACRQKYRDRFSQPPQLSREFFDTPEFREAFASHDMGKIFLAYRTDPRHKPVYGPTGITQGLLGMWLNMTQAHVSRIELGKHTPQRHDTLTFYAQTLHLPTEWLWFDLPGSSRVSIPAKKAKRQYEIEPNVKLRAAREAVPSKTVPGQCMNRAELAEAVNNYLWRTTKKRYDLDAHGIGRYESGAVRWPGDMIRAGLRAVLGAESDAELGFFPTPRGPNAAPTTVPVVTPEVANGGRETLLKELLRGKHAQSYSAFCRLYKKTATALDSSLVDTYPAERQYYRWLSGDITKLPYPEHCAVLEAMFPEYSANQLFESSERQSDGSGELIIPTTSTGHVSAAESKEEDVNRLEFIGGLLATIAAPGSLFSESARIGANDIARCRQNLEQLYSLDDHYGASAEVYSLTVRSLRKILRDLERKSYTPAIGQGVRTVAGELMEHAGWLAFDAGQNVHARYWWLEALHTARMADCEAVEVVVLASMSLAASKQGRGREAVDLANAAQRAVKSHQTPRLLSVLSAREALGHAHSGDERAAAKALAMARSYLDRGDCHDDDPSWLDFWGPSDFFGHEAQAQRNLNNLTSAERSVREALASVDADSHPRNHALYLSRLAVILAASKKYDEAVPITAKAVLRANDVNSDRLTSEVKTALTDISSMGDASKSRELVEWASPMLSRTAPWPREI